MVGEKVGMNKKTDYSDTFMDLEVATDAKKEAVSRLFTSATSYIKLLGKKDDKEKVVVPEALGAVMLQAGQSLPNSAYGEALVHVGEAQQTVGHSTIELVVKLRQNFYENLERANTEILEYKALRKKLEHRRVEYDSKLNKVQKAKKESPELEEDMREARVKYDECLKDTEAKMQQVMEGDDVLMRDLASYVDAHVEYFRKGLEVFERVGQEIASSGIRASTPPPPVRASTRMSSMDGDDGAALSRRTTVKSTFDKASAFTTGAVSSVKQSISGGTAHARARPTSLAPARKPSKPKDNRKIVQAVFVYAAEEDNELALEEGDRIAVTEEVDAGWWIGENVQDGRSGMFPANYVKVVQEASVAEDPVEEEPVEESTWGGNKRNTIAGAFSSVTDRFSAKESTPPPAASTVATGGGRRVPPMPSFGSKGAAPPRPAGDSKPPAAAKQDDMETYVAKQAVGYAIKHPKQAMAAAGAMAGFAAKAHNYQQSHATKSTCKECGCEDFKENVFKPGNCNNCFHKH